MATSGSVDFSVSRDDLIKYALHTNGVLGEGETPSSTQLTEGAWFLNALVKARMVDGMPLWALKQGYVLPTTGTSTYSLGSSVHAVTTYVDTTTTAALAIAATALVVTSITGISASDVIGVEQGDGTMHWTTANGAPSGSTITLTTGPTVAVVSGAQVYAYTTTNRIVRPLRIVSAYLYSSPDDNRTPLTIVSKEQYFSLGGPTEASVPNQIYYDPQLSSGILYVYPRFLTGDNLIEITFHRPFEDFDAASDTPDFPQEWYLALMFELSSLLGKKYGVALDERKTLMAEATYWRELALSGGTEEGSLYMSPNVTE